MTDKPGFASLSAGLLARKGAARPAMRTQLYKFVEDDDLGWNDMGTDMLTPEQQAMVSPAPVVALVNIETQALDVEVDTGVPVPDVHVQQDRLMQAFDDDAEPAPPPLASSSFVMQPQPRFAPPPRAAPGSKGKSAFTLRLDPDRHLKLRLASAVTHRSAQQLCVEALDRFLNELAPGVAALAEVKGHG